MPDPTYFDYDQASEYLRITKKCLENYARVGRELDAERVGRRKLFAKPTLDTWRRQREFQAISLSRADYLSCLEFAVKSFYAYRSTSDFRSSQQRGVGKFVSDFISGKLGEIAVAKFLKRHFDIDVKLDFELREAVVGQDIAEIAKPRQGGRVYNPPNLRLAIKTTKIKNVFLVVAQNEAEDTVRFSDVYISCRVDLPLNHVLRILREHEALASLADIIPSFEPFLGEVNGFAERQDLTCDPVVTELPSLHQSIQPSYIMRSGMLKRSREQWSALIERL